MFTKKFPQRQKGAALIIIIFFFIAISIAILQSTTVGALSELRLYRTFTTSKFSYVATEAAIEDIIYRQTNNLNIPYSGLITLSLNGANATATRNTFEEIPGVSVTDNYSTGMVNSQMRNIFTQLRQGTSVPVQAVIYPMSLDQGGITMGANSHIAVIAEPGFQNRGIVTGGTIAGASGATIDVNVMSGAGLPDPTAQQSVNVSVTQNVAAPNAVTVAQSFTVPGAGTRTLTKVALMMRRVGAPANAVIRIVPTSPAGNFPDTTTLASTTLNYALVPTGSANFIGLPFLNPVALTPGSVYWIVVDTMGGTNATNYWQWSRSNVDTAYTGGTAKYSASAFNTGAWNALSSDMAFKTYFDQELGTLDTVIVNGQAYADVIKNSTINGNASYQLISNSVVTGGSFISYGYQYAFPFPSSQITQLEADATAGGVITGNCGTGGTPGCDTFPLQIGPKKIVGNLTVNTGEVLTLTGTTYVTGNVIVNGGTINCHSGFVNKNCALVADGHVSITNDARISGSGGTLSKLYIITDIPNCLGGGSAGTGCATNQSGIFVDTGAELGIDVTLIAPTSEVYVGSGGTISAVVAYGLEMAANAQAVLYSPPGEDAFEAAVITPTATTSTGIWTPTRWGEF